ncbi:hypothetical protein TNCV_4718571 [Trichonephila clavipes]|nr:hypothetical protein TNCV_4718571 [Trichonephila clavipes]
MAKHKPRKSAPTEYTTDDEDLIMYDVEEEELEPDPTDKFPIKECPANFPKGYLRALTPTLFRKEFYSRSPCLGSFIFGSTQSISTPTFCEATGLGQSNRSKQGNRSFGGQTSSVPVPAELFCPV